jgi:hypothetical protein
MVAELERVKANAGCMARLRIYLSSFPSIDHYAHGAVRPSLGEGDLSDMLRCIANIAGLGIHGHFHEEAMDVLGKAGFEKASSFDRENPRFREAYESTLMHNVPLLEVQIATYLSNFKNTGVTVYANMHEAFFGKCK